MGVPQHGPLLWLRLVHDRWRTCPSSFFFHPRDSIITDNIQGGKGGKGESQRLEPMSRRPDQPSPLSPVFFSAFSPFWVGVLRLSGGERAVGGWQ